MSLMNDRVFLFLLWMQTDNLVVMPGSMTVMTWKLCVTIITIKSGPPGNILSQHNHSCTQPRQYPSLDNTFKTSYCLWFSQDGSKCNVFILFILQSSRFPKQEKSPPMITMLTRSLTNWKRSGKYNWSWDVVIYPRVWYSWRTWNVNRPARFCRVKRFKSFLVSLSMVTDGRCLLHAFPINSSSVFQRNRSE